MFICLHFPLILGDDENFVEADPSVTPHHIQPEWYFLFAYAILRSIPNKLGGVIALALSVAVLYTIPLTNRITTKKKINNITPIKTNVLTISKMRTFIVLDRGATGRRTLYFNRTSINCYIFLIFHY